MCKSGQESSWMSGIGREALTGGREWSGFPAKCPELAGRHSQMCKSGWEALLDIC